MATFSSTLMVGSRRTCWKVRLMPSLAISREASPVDRARRRKKHLARSGGSTPEMQLNIVLLPAPLGPIRAIISPARP
jgi:hypothetical protein